MYTYMYIVKSVLSKRHLYITNHSPMKKLETRKEVRRRQYGGDNQSMSSIITIRIKYIVMYTLILQNNDFKDITSMLACFDHQIVACL